MPSMDETKRDFDVFISYSSKDKAIADAVVAAHEQAGIRCWYTPRDIAPGADWADSITKAIHDCSIMVLIFSKEANRSQRVIDEVNYAISQEKPLLPFRIESYNPTGALSLHLSSRHWLDAYESGWETHIERLVMSVAANLEHSVETIQLGERVPIFTTGENIPQQRTKKKSSSTLIYLAIGIVSVSLLGYFGWNFFSGGQPARIPASSTGTSAGLTPSELIPETSESGETTAPEPSEEISYTAVLHGSIIETEFFLDPRIRKSAGLTPNLFLTLTEYDYENATVIPGAAKSWTVSPDGRIYTFTLWPDIPWVNHSLGGETIRVTDDEGMPRFLTAEDFEYSYKMLCDPRVEDPNPDQFYPRPTNIQGCSEILEYPDPENIPQVLFDQIGVEAISDTELIFSLENPSGYFLTETTNSSFSAIPSWAIEKYGEAWTNPGLMPTNGAYVIDEWKMGENIRLIRNQLLPSVLSGTGNINTVELTVVEDINEEYEYWKNDQIDYVLVPRDLRDNYFDQYPNNITRVTKQLVAFGIFMNRDPFDNVHLRRAFSASFNRNHDAFQGYSTPMKHFAPPGVFGAPPIDEVGVGYDLEYARSELELAGYPNCHGLPRIVLQTPSMGETGSNDEIIRSWEEGLGCPEGTIAYNGIPWTGTGDDVDWDIFIIGWVSDFPDEESWVGAALHCDSMHVHRNCNGIDELIVQAKEEINASDRIELYRQIEEFFFGRDGTFPIAPLFLHHSYVATADWLEVVQFGDYLNTDYSDWWINEDAKEAALEE